MRLGLPGSSVVKNPPANAGDTGWSPGLGRSPGVGNDNPFLPEKFHGQRSLAGYNPWGRQESDMAKQLSTHAHFEVKQGGPTRWFCKYGGKGPLAARHHATCPRDASLGAGLCCHSYRHNPLEPAHCPKLGTPTPGTGQLGQNGPKGQATPSPGPS